MTNYGCNNGLPHDFTVLKDNRRAKWEVCIICNKKMRWTKGFKGRIANVEYLKAHARNYAQPNGATNRLYQRIYHPENCIIKI